MLATVVLTVGATLVVVVIARNFATPEKKLERKLEHKYPVADPQFRREMSVMLGPSIVPGNRVEALQNGAEIFPAMLGAIREAQVSVNFETYIYWSGEIGQEFSRALSERARAGIPVNVTIDWVGSSRMEQSQLDEMERAGVMLRRYRPLKWYNLGRLNNRTHRKLLIVDGRVGFTGGVGIADQWEGNAEDPEHWRDTHFRVEGPVVAQMQGAFNDNWMKMTGQVLNGTAYYPHLDPAGESHAQLFIASPAGGSESMHLMYLMAFAAAEQSIDLASAYFVPDQLVKDALIAARRRGVRVRMLLPGKHCDSETVRVSSRGEWGDLLQAGVEIHLFQPTMMHCKLLVIDQELVSMGSTNIDIRSFRLNDEANLNTYDHAFARQMVGCFEEDLRRATQYSYADWKQRSLRSKLFERILLPIKSQL